MPMITNMKILLVQFGRSASRHREYKNTWPTFRDYVEIQHDLSGPLHPADLPALALTHELGVEELQV